MAGIMVIGRTSFQVSTKYFFLFKVIFHVLCRMIFPIVLSVIFLGCVSIRKNLKSQFEKKYKENIFDFEPHKTFNKNNYKYKNINKNNIPLIFVIILEKSHFDK